MCLRVFIAVKRWHERITLFRKTCNRGGSLMISEVQFVFLLMGSMVVFAQMPITESFSRIKLCCDVLLDKAL